MTDITYTPQFTPPGWRDNVDLVSADGPNGFNVQFTALRGELDQLSNRIKQLSDAINAVGQRPPTQTRMSLPPTLIQVAGIAGWNQHPGYVDKPSTQTSAQGIMSVELPNHAQILSLLLAGQNVSSGGTAGTGNLRVMLRRQKVVLDNPPVFPPKDDTVVTVVLSGTSLSASAPADTTLGVVDMDNFKYYVLAQLDNSQPTDTVVLNAFQITYLA